MFAHKIAQICADKILNGYLNSWDFCGAVLKQAHLDGLFAGMITDPDSDAASDSALLYHNYLAYDIAMKFYNKGNSTCSNK